MIRSLLLLLPLLVACHVAGLSLPWATFSAMVPDTTNVTVGACRTGPGLAVSLTREGRDYLLLAKDDRWLVILFDDAGNAEHVWFGVGNKDDALVAREDLSRAEVLVKYPSPCDYLDRVPA